MLVVNCSGGDGGVISCGVGGNVCQRLHTLESTIKPCVNKYIY